MSRARTLLALMLVTVASLPLVTATSTAAVASEPVNTATSLVVTPGDTWGVQYLRINRPVCGQTWWSAQLFRVEWNMAVYHDNLYVYDFKLTIWNDDPQPMTVGDKSINSADDPFWSWYVGWDFVPAINGDFWSKTYPVNRFFTWMSGGNIQLLLNVAAGCGGDYLTLVFELQKDSGSCGIAAATTSTTTACDPGGGSGGGGGGGGGTNPPIAPTGIAVKRNDYNRDGVSDIVAVKDDYLHIWFGTGSGGFLYGGPIGPGWTPYASTLTGVGDINRDGNGDLVAVYNDYIYTWFGTGSGGFATGGPIGPGWTPYASTLTGMGDINRDGNGDMLAISNDYIYTWFGTGSGGFATGGPIGSGWNVYAPIH